MTERLRERLPPDDSYSVADDLRASIEFAYRAIRQRAANGGRGWRGWPPESPAASPNFPEARRE
jgi:hypothetical protein